MKSCIKVKHILLLLSLLLTVLNKTYAVTTTYLENGETSLIKLPIGSKYVLSNKGNLSVKLINNQKTLLIKAKRPGRANIAIISPDGTSKKHSFYIGSNEALKTVTSIMAELKSFKIPFSQINRKKIKLNSPVNTKSDYLTLVHILNQLSHSVEVIGTVDPKLQLEILQDIYLKFISSEIQSIYCDFDFLIINCHSETIEKGAEQIVNELKSHYAIKFTQTEKLNKRANYQLEVKIVQVETHQDRERNGGLNNIDLSLSQLLQKNLDSLIDQKKIFIGDINSTVSLLAEPKIKIKLEKKSTVKIGNEVRFLVPNQNGISQERWKFFGFDLSFIISKYGANFETAYEFSFSTPPQSGNTNLNTSNSTAILQIERPKKLFEFNIDMSTKDSSSIPWINKVPLIGSLFKNRNHSHITKKVFAFATLKKEY